MNWLLTPRLCTAAVLLVAVVSAAQARDGEWKSYTGKREVRDATHTTQNDSTIIWAATAGGMFSSTQGHSYAEFTPSEGLTTIDLTAIAADSSGNLWIGAQNGFLHRYEPATKRWTYIADIAIRTDPSRRINALVVTGDTLFILSDIGVSLFAISKMEFGDTYSSFGAQPNQFSGNATSMSFHNGKLWVGTRNGVASTSINNPNPSAPESWQIATTAQGLPSNAITGLTKFDTLLVAATSNGLATENSGTWTAIPGSAGLNVIGMNAASTDVRCPGVVHFITLHDIWRYDGTGIQNAGNLNSYTLTRISPEGYLGSQQHGVLTVDYCPLPPGSQAAIQGSYSPPGPPSNKFVGLAIDDRSVVWSGTGISNGEGFMSFDGASWRSYTPSADGRLGAGNFYRVHIGRDNAKWVSGWGDGVALVDDGGTVQRVFTTSNGLSPSIDPTFVVVGGVATDENGVAWIANRTPRGDTSIVTFHPDSALAYTRGIVTRNSPVTVLADVIIDQYGTKWFTNFSRYEGVIPYALWYYNERFALPGTTGGWGKITIAEGLATNKVYSLAAGRDGEIWVGSDAGVSIIYDASNPYSIAQYHPPQVQDQIVQSIAVDALNNKWLGTRQGVFVFSPDGTTLLNRYTVKNTDGKLLDDDVVSVAIDHRTGTIYFGTEKGLSTLATAAVEPVRSFSDLTFAPNPMLVPSATAMTIDGLIENSTIKIISIQGSVVAEFRSPGGRVAYWDGKTEKGAYVGTGIYIVVAYSEDGTKVAKGKIAVIRK